MDHGIIGLVLEVVGHSTPESGHDETGLSHSMLSFTRILNEA